MFLAGRPLSTQPELAASWRDPMRMALHPPIHYQVLPYCTISLLKEGVKNILLEYVVSRQSLEPDCP